MPVYYVSPQGGTVVSGSGGGSGGGSFTVYSAFIDAAAGGETTLAKPLLAPPIPDSESTELYIDGRKARRGANRTFTVAPDGSFVTFAALLPGQDVELRYTVPV